MIFDRSMPSARIFAFIAESMRSGCCAAARPDRKPTKNDANSGDRIDIYTPDWADGKITRYTFALGHLLSNVRVVHSAVAVLR
jgi:hypothetical protein